MRRDASGLDLAIEAAGQATLEAINSATAPLTNVLNEKAVDQFIDLRAEIGEPVVFTADVVRTHLAPERPADRRWIVRVRGSKVHVLVTEAQVMWKSEHGVVLVGGLIAGSTLDDDGTPLVVVQGGYIVSPS